MLVLLCKIYRNRLFACFHSSQSGPRNVTLINPLLSVCWVGSWSVCHDILKWQGNCISNAPIGALVNVSISFYSSLQARNVEIRILLTRVLRPTYRVFIKYCVFSKILKYIPDSGLSRFSLVVNVCTQWQVKHQRCSRTCGVQKNHNNLRKNAIFNEHPCIKSNSGPTILKVYSVNV